MYLQENWLYDWLCFLLQQTGEYATDEEDGDGTVADEDKNIEVFDLPESEEILSPTELDATKLYQKFREVKKTEFVPPHFSLLWRIRLKYQMYPHTH